MILGADLDFYTRAFSFAIISFLTGGGETFGFAIVGIGAVED